MGSRKLWRTARIAALVVTVAVIGVISGCAMRSNDHPLDGAGLTRLYIDAPTGHSLSYLWGGDPQGQRVIFVHGTPGEAEVWLDLLQKIPPGIEVLAVDRPGFGQTTPRGAVTSLKAQAAALLPLLTERDGQFPILVGHSLGGPIIAQAAVDYPDRIGGLVIAAGALDPGQEKTYFVQYLGAAPPLRWILPRSIRNANRELMALKPELATLAQRLDALTAPTIIVHGTKDEHVPYENVAFMETHLSHAQRLDLIRLDGRNHFLPWNSKPELWQAVERLTHPDHRGD